MNFWQKLPQPIIGLSPMDGVTDAAFREITDIYGRPDVLYSEFIPVEALEHNAPKVLHAFRKHASRTPIVAQLFGTSVSSYYLATLVILELGFDGIDINMGCPDRHVVLRGGGAALIKNPKLALSIIRIIKQAIQDRVNGRTLESLHPHPYIIDFVKKYAHAKKKLNRIPISVKTRIGYDRVVTSEWINYLIQASPDLIALHGRTLNQMYRGKADWDEIAKAAELCSKNHILLLGNGDIHSSEEAKQKSSAYQTDGVLVGRAALGNPWIFTGKTVEWDIRASVMLQHAKLFLRYRPELNLIPMRKHFTWYCKYADHAAETRNALMKVITMQELDSVLNPV